jgi:hypothetical protein
MRSWIIETDGWHHFGMFLAEVPIDISIGLLEDTMLDLIA